MKLRTGFTCKEFSRFLGCTNEFFASLSSADKRAFSAHPLEFFVYCVGAYRDFMESEKNRRKK